MPPLCLMYSSAQSTDSSWASAPNTTRNPANMMSLASRDGTLRTAHCCSVMASRSAMRESGLPGSVLRARASTAHAARCIIASFRGLMREWSPVLLSSPANTQYRLALGMGLERRQPVLVHESQHPVLRGTQPLPAHVERRALEGLGPGPASHAIPGFQDQHVQPGTRELPSREQAGQPGSHNHHVDVSQGNLRGQPMPPGQSSLPRHTTARASSADRPVR